MDEITAILRESTDNPDAAYDKLMPLVYNKLRNIAGMRMNKESLGHTFSKTDLVHEAYIKLVDINQLKWQGRAHFYAVASRCMRRILIDYARKKNSQKRGGKQEPLTYLDHLFSAHKQAKWLIDLDMALDELADRNERLAQVVECRYFGEMQIDETAKALNISPATVKRDWKKAKGWLYHRLRSDITSK
ncbi:ECF-type sigma factor [Fodinibius halophilus]|uniref:Sigma-70 family RNA polymerase sigma factor n=1 Tax=Fodinibius halophilus TaxID=1736908 RepID=A0A6M1TCZ0_9BACT|nr:ECF-type sigma factor [Fodinibius halophilus]NGP88032.1 sigma-70 family RNA polymerase sigma factor [Fodinibius halophilus]